MKTTSATLLVIDDVEENCEILKRRFEKEGYHVETAYDGQEALLQLSKRVINLILLDLNMPVMNGFTFLEKVKSDNKFSDIPVLIISSLDDEYTANDCLQFGACGFMFKPYEMDKILSQIKSCLMGR